MKRAELVAFASSSLFIVSVAVAAPPAVAPGAGPSLDTIANVAGNLGQHSPIMGTIDVPAVAQLRIGNQPQDTLDLESITLFGRDNDYWTVTITTKKGVTTTFSTNGLVFGTEGDHIRLLRRESETWRAVDIGEGLGSMSIEFGQSRGTAVLNGGAMIVEPRGEGGGVSVQFSERSGTSFGGRG